MVFTVILLHQKALSYIKSYQVIIFSHDIPQCQRVHITFERYLPRTKTILKTITWLSKTKARLQQGPSPAILDKAILMLPDWHSKAILPHPVPTIRNAERRKNIRLNCGYELSLILFSSKCKLRQEQLHAKLCFIQKTASAESMGQCWTPVEERNISQLPLLWLLCPSTYNHTNNFLAIFNG